MKRLATFILLSFITVLCLAQVQNGIVKTNGRPNKPGIPLGNVSVKASGHNASLSTADGLFSIDMNGLKDGESFFLTSVTRPGFELADRNAIGRKYGFSSSVPMVLTMVSKTELEEEKQRIRNNAIEATQKKYSDKIEKLEQELEEHIISEEVFSEQLQEMQKNMDQYNELIENLADKYARTDYDIIDSIDRKINEAIEDGMFDKADSLIHSKGDINERHHRIMEWAESSKKQKEAIDRQMEQWEATESSRLKELDNLADDYYNSFTIEVSRMEPEKAAAWLDKRVELDPERFDWLIEAGKYYKTYLGRNDRALLFFDRAYSVAQKTEIPSQHIIAQNEMGGVYTNLHETGKARECYNEVISLAGKNREQFFQAIASAYNNIGLVESISENRDEALKYYEKSLAVAPDTLLPSAVSTYANIAAVYHHKNLFDTAYIYLDKAIEIAERTNDKLVLSACYQNKGAILNAQGRDEEAVEAYNKSLTLQKKIFPASHPAIATTLSNISTSYYSLSRIQEAFDYDIQALEIYLAAYGEKHPDVANCYKSIATILTDAGNYDKALIYANKSWEINRTFYPEKSSKYASHNVLLGLIYEGKKQDSISTDCYKTAMAIYESIQMDRTSSYASVLNNLSSILTNQKKYDEAIEYAKKSMELTSSIKGKENSTYIKTMSNLAYIYDNSGRADSALTINRANEELILKVYGKWHVTLSRNYNNTGSIYLNSKEYDKARDYFIKSLEICDSIYEQPAELPMIICGNMAMTYYNDSRWREAIPWFEKSATIRRQIVSEPQRQFAHHNYIYISYYKLSESGEEADIRNFKQCQDTLWMKVSILPEGNAAQKYGLSGEYLMLKYGNWEHGSEMYFTDEFDRIKNIAPKVIIIYRDGRFEKVQFEEARIGVNFYMTLLDLPKSLEIKEAYAKWKKDNGIE